MTRPRSTRLAATESAEPGRSHAPILCLIAAWGRCLGWRTRGGRGPQRGSITAETAVALPALVVVLAVALWGVSAAAAQIACLDAARAGARAAARGERLEAVRTAVLRAAPANARVVLSRDPVSTRVVVRAEASSPLSGLFPALKLEAEAVAATEPEGREGDRQASDG